MENRSHQELFGHGKSLPPQIVTFHFCRNLKGGNILVGPVSHMAKLLRIENPRRFAGLRFSSLGGGDGDGGCFRAGDVNVWNERPD